MTKVTRQDIIQPKGQKFALGDLVRFTKPAVWDRTGQELWRVAGADDEPGENVGEASDSYLLVGAEDPEEDKAAWPHDNELELVPEGECVGCGEITHEVSLATVVGPIKKKREDDCSMYGEEFRCWVCLPEDQKEK